MKNIHTPLWITTSLLIIFAIWLTACGGAPPVEEPVAPEEPMEEPAEEPMEEPAEEPMEEPRPEFSFPPPIEGEFVCYEESEMICAISDEIEVTYPEISLSYKNKNQEVAMWLKILTLHYLVQAKGTPATGNDITFKQLEGGLGYYSAFQGRTIKPLLNVFDSSMDSFIKTAESLGGTRTNHSKYSVSFKVFPNSLH